MSVKRRITSGLTGTLAGAGAGAQLGSLVPGLGTVVGAIGGGLVGLLGGALTPDETELTDADKEQLRLQREQQDEQKRQFGLEFGQKQFSDSKTFGLAGLNQLANQRTEAAGKLRKYNFHSALYNAARGA